MIASRHLARLALGLSVAACGSDQAGAASDGGDDGTFDDGTLTDGEGHPADGSVSDAPSADGTDSDVAGDAGITDAAEENCLKTVGDASCWSCTRDPHFALSWNEVCGGQDPATGFILQWGPGPTAGTYTNTLDAGDPCDASLCGGDAAPDAQQYCAFDLQGLEAGAWCIVAYAYDDAGTRSGPSVPPFCGALPAHCP
jgi:hypothetical protein